MGTLIEEIQLLDNSGLPFREKYIYLKRLLERYCKEITANEALQFPSLFSRLVFISQKYKLPKSFEWQLQNIRVKASDLLQDENENITANQYLSAKKTFINLINHIAGDKNIAEQSIKAQTTNIIPNRIRVQVTNIDNENKIITAHADNLTNEEIHIRYDIKDVNNQFNETLNRLWVGAQLNLIDCKTDNKGYYIPKTFVLEPDYMIDASAIAECFQTYGSSHLHYFRRKFEQIPNTHYILLGNLANYFLDELIYADNPKDLLFDSIFKKSFRYMSFEYALCKDIRKTSDFKEFMLRAKIQFENIKRVVTEDMPVNGFNISNCTLEPSFYCEKYGFQGRLDLLQLSKTKEDLTRIIELKSGKPPYPRTDITKIAPNHEAQTVVYRLMIQSVFGLEARQVYAAILYSSAENKNGNLRLAATYKQLEKEILNIRNLIVATEHDLYTGNSDTVSHIFDELFDMANYVHVPDYFINKIADFQKIINKTSELEREYFFRFISFISRELYLQKMGDDSSDSFASTSALWNIAFEDRKESLELIENLTITEIEDSGRDMKISLKRTESASCANFREGETCIFYPRQTSNDTILTNQILKGNIAKISDTDVILRFRYKQKNRDFFANQQYWVVEHDRLDHSYNAMFRSLSAFLDSKKDERNLLLGLRQPQTDYVPDTTLNESNINDKQKNIINKALAAKDYFLLVGPPGTGKTSIFIRKLIEKLHYNSETQILVMAYTNRAVDELCAAICSAFGEDESICDKYIRIGTELSSAEPYRHRLLQIISQGVETRNELTEIISNCRIFVGTAAAIIGKLELFDIKKFDIALIDEASQILEPQIIGLLPKFEKFIMIGDHNQLSTITLQDENKSKIDNPILNKIGLKDCRESLFERLYRICKKNGWINIYDTVTFHGRMHEEIAEFVNIHFYNNQLRIATERQKQSLFYNEFNADDDMQRFIARNRIAFFPSRCVFAINLSDKMNLVEAEIVKEIANTVYELYKLNNLVFDPNKTIGIIAPFRNQIALIRQKLQDSYIPNPENIMVDTVERFQGSQRDIIIISCCMNKPYQLRSFSNMNGDGTVDRKLNVALTRAREQLFIVGNDLVMKEKPIYKKLIESLA